MLKIILTIGCFGLVVAVSPLCAESIYFIDRTVSSRYVEKNTETAADWRTAETLQRTLTEWAKVDGWSLIWELSDDYEIQREAIFRGSFTEILSEFQLHLPPGTALIVYEVNKVLRVTPR